MLLSRLSAVGSAAALIALAVAGNAVAHSVPSAGVVAADVAAHAGHGAAPVALEPLAQDCSASQLQIHNGFQEAPRCVVTEFGEMTTAEKSPTLQIVSAPHKVKAGEAFQIKVSTRNLVRDRFLAAGQGGYYLESSQLDASGLIRGHFHTPCQMVGSAAPTPDRQFDTFVATEDGKGGAEPDTVTVTIGKGLPTAGEARCAAWAGDGSHRVPMMQFANQIPAFDSVRIEVK